MMDQFAPILQKGLRSGIWVFGLIMALNNAGYDVGALLAGVGIGGLALAMAAKDFVSNIFGGITIFADKPFKVGDSVLGRSSSLHICEVCQGCRHLAMPSASGFWRAFR